MEAAEANSLVHWQRPQEVVSLAPESKTLGEELFKNFFFNVEIFFSVVSMCLL